LLAEEMNIGGVLVPPLPGTLCAHGALRAAAMTDIVRTVREPLSQLDGRQLAAAFAPSVERGRAWLEREASTAHRTELRLSAEMRYIGQAYELEVPVRPEWLERSALGPLATAFHDLHERVFFHADREAPVEVVDLRVRAVGLVDHPPDPAPLPPSRQSPRPEGRRRVLIGGGLHDTPVYARAALAAGDELDGPLVVHQSDATTLIPPGWNVMVDSGGNLLASRKVRDAN
jgi:N-methylhydantoinase A